MTGLCLGTFGAVIGTDDFGRRLTLLGMCLVAAAQSTTLRSGWQRGRHAFKELFQRNAQAVTQRCQCEQRWIDVAVLQLGDARALHFGVMRQLLL